MLVGSACKPCWGGNRIAVTGIYNPWQSDLVVVNARSVSIQLANEPVESVIVGGALPQSMGTPLWRPDQLQDAQTWVQIDLRPLGTVIYPAAEIAPTRVEVEQGVRSSPAKVLLRYQQVGAGPIFAVVDIGEGITFFVPPTSDVALDLLIPNPETNDEVLTPPDFDPNAFRFATVISAKGTMVSSPGPVSATNTQCVFVDQSADGNEQQVLLPPGARTVQIFSTPPTGAVPLLGDTVASFVQEYSRLPPGPAPPPFDTFDRQQIPFVTPFTTERVRVPAGGFTAIRIRAAAGSRSVCVVTELDL